MWEIFFFSQDFLTDVITVYVASEFCWKNSSVQNEP